MKLNCITSCSVWLHSIGRTFQSANLKESVLGAPYLPDRTRLAGNILVTTASLDLYAVFHLLSGVTIMVVLWTASALRTSCPLILSGYHKRRLPPHLQPMKARSRCNPPRRLGPRPIQRQLARCPPLHVEQLSVDLESIEHHLNIQSGSQK